MPLVEKTLCMLNTQNGIRTLPQYDYINFLLQNCNNSIYCCTAKEHKIYFFKSVLSLFCVYFGALLNKNGMS